MSIKERFERRQMSKAEYYDLLHQYRLQYNDKYRPFFNQLPEYDGDTWQHPFWQHVYCVGKAQIDKRRELQFQYVAVSDRYSYYLTMLEADEAGCRYEAELERAASAYHMGYAIGYPGYHEEL